MNFSLILKKRLYLLYADEVGAERIQELKKMLEDNGLPYEFQCKEKGFEEWLAGQKMGSYLYGAVHSNKINKLKQIAKNAGFSEEEMQWVGIGCANKQVFCSKCHTIQASGNQNQVICQNCGLPLDITDHYSFHHQAYLGYPAE